MKSFNKVSMILFGSMFSMSAAIAQQNLTVTGPDMANQASGVLDFENAKPMPMPDAGAMGVRPPSLLNALNSLGSQQSASTGKFGATSGSRGSGELNNQTAIAPKPVSPEVGDGVGSQEYGTHEHPYSTVRVDYGTRVSKYWPFRTTGKLIFNIPGEGTFVCSASLIKKGVLVTAAHCVAPWGGASFYDSFVYQPARYGGNLPYSSWNASYPIIMTTYYNGTAANCYVAGVICDNDVAVLRVPEQAYNGSNHWIGDVTGWLGYAYNGYGFTPNDATSPLGTYLAQIAQLGYPVTHDNGTTMQRTDSVGYKNATFAYNSIIGSRQTGGSSGGPWIVNFGKRANLSGTAPGSEAAQNRVVGVTSWGYTSNLPKVQGASAFTSGNIVPLVSAACGGGYGGC